MIDLQSKIQWTDFTLNAWEGCFKVDEECKFCYMYRDLERYGRDPRNIREISIKTINKKLKAARELLAARQAEGDPTPVKIFMSSWTDVFLKEADHLRSKLWDIIRENHDLVFQILTKRPELIPDRLPADWGDGWANVWLGTSVGQPKGVKRIRDIQRVKAKTLFLSCEPLIAELHLDQIVREEDGWAFYDNCLTGFFAHKAGGWYGRKIDWVIVGGESGNDTGKYQHRPCQFHWIVDIIRQCERANVPVFVKQLGTHLSKQLKLSDWHGGNIDEWPEHLRVRQMPEVSV